MGINQTLRTKLGEYAEEKHRQYHMSVVLGQKNMLGVRMPKVRELAKWAAKQDWQSEWDDLSEDCYEELMIKGLLIGYGKLSREEQTAYLKKYIPLISSWEICDGCCVTCKFMQKDQEYWFTFLQPYLRSEQELEARFAVVCMMNYFVNEEYLERLFQAFVEVKEYKYFSEIAVAWAVARCYIKYPSQTWEYLEKRSLNDYIRNQAIQKIRESTKVSEEDKERLCDLKVNTK